ncbi:hypothetical protein MHYP_G00050540 [Metynnis hypsauchen]
MKDEELTGCCHITIFGVESPQSLSFNPFTLVTVIFLHIIVAVVYHTKRNKEPPQSLPFIPFALVTVIILHIIVAVVYHTKRNKVPDAATIYYSSDDEDGAVTDRSIEQVVGVVISAVVLSLYVVRRLCNSGRMQVGLYLLLVLHVAEGRSPLNDADGVAEPPQSLPFIPFALVTVIFLHIIVAVFYYTKRNKGPDAATITYTSDDEDGAVSLQQRIKPTDINRPAVDNTSDLLKSY